MKKMNEPPPDFSVWPQSRLELLLSDYRSALGGRGIASAERLMYWTWIRALEKELSNRENKP